MRVAGAPGVAAVPVGRDVEPKLTAVSKSELRGAIERAHQRVTGRSAPSGLVDVLTAHASLETASGARMYNFNFGGIKGRGPSGDTTRCRTHEVLDGKDVVIRDNFRAYGSLDEGASDYVRLMRNRFPAAVAAAERGDLDGFAGALKRSGYYTADEKAYASALHRLVGDAPTPTPRALATAPALSNANLAAAIDGASPSALPDSVQLERVMNALSRHHRLSDDDDVE